MELDDFNKSNLKHDGNEIERSLNHDSRTDQFLEIFKTEIKNQRKKSVSYTHLDVYKRQVLSFESRGCIKV